MNNKKAIILGTLGAILVGLCSFAFSKYAPKTKVSAANADVLETLENTTWYFNNNNLTKPFVYEGATGIAYTINFKYANNETQYTKLHLGAVQAQEYAIVRFQKENGSYTNAFAQNTWNDQQYRTISFTTGSSATNINLINWVKQNAIKVELTTLKKTTWQLKETLETIPAGLAKFNLTLHCNGFMYGGLELGYSTATQTQADTIRYAGMIVYENGIYTSHSRQRRYFIIEDGNDVENKQAIAWLTKNATLYNTFNSLTNTKWTIIQNPYFEDRQVNMSLEFTSNKKTFLNIKSDANLTYIDYTEYKGINNPTEDIRVYSNNMWNREAYKTIIISGGNSAETLGAQSRLISNATGVEFTPIPSGTGYDIEDGNFTSLQSLIFKILTMPFTFIAQAFNVTLWPNTAWEFNIGNFILAIIAISAVLFIIKAFTSGFSVIGNYTNNRNQNRLTKSKIENNKSATELNRAKTEKVKKETK